MGAARRKSEIISDIISVAETNKLNFKFYCITFKVRSLIERSADPGKLVRYGLEKNFSMFRTATSIRIKLRLAISRKSGSFLRMQVKKVRNYPRISPS